MLSKFKRSKHQQHLAQLPKIPQSVADVRTLYAPSDYRTALLDAIASATQRIYLVALYLEHDDAGRDILNALYQAKQLRPELEICVLVDWHRAQRGRIGAAAANTNADWYCAMAQQHPDLSVPVYGVPVNTREALGVLHLKGFIVDDTVIYSGASINDVYLHQHDKYRYDRYQLLNNAALANAMVDYIRQHLLTAGAVQRLDRCDRPKSPEIKNETRQFRLALRHDGYRFSGNAGNDELAVTPLVGLGKQSVLNKTIHHLMACTDQKLTLCTPYFNLPALLVRNIIYLLRQGKQVEIIVGDKTANDFYIPQDQPFKIIGALPYLYEINLRRFITRLQRYVDTGQLIVRLWKDGDNSYHLKGIWVDDEWQLLTGNNLNPRAWRLDLENAILIHDPNQEMREQRAQELECIRAHTTVVGHYQELESIQQYPVKVRKLIRRLRRIRIDRLISRIL
ncbi:CDP-diacylglycerol--serine O-phosphatidyltransferase [Serratia rubidaea]|uniref:CDP-diacylglycerol--serine O-phosphatidyltransferase n=1 Tax=Serratia rubidaea TaxID=61652 RepID=A0A4U9HRU5_SERRU|nr:CDP-diacylglycerol--serine O-phosphatidyltransferase [Serratia rubidaea]QPR63959.1 CDP-diacylglycerol--serine O-phosphatidyltransferase [Serratia rubidaea]CAI1179531.1 CDP-diacylglycerol--serine O-phosphatidyltransferase [Serratia rubidaea]CAI1988997.1 CDP-diacylglycerol--serine O-phosphatidyltransferase [Serratia rubidaea]VTP66171.1 CDP-diacylglycerol--serine O-phosphatidyltransferase [Serratia rubidaea]HAY0639599.1 CDP-diacylglycerol--serine O-phosphatidyltransferase [Serratia rubidaea]